MVRLAIDPSIVALLYALFSLAILMLGITLWRWKDIPLRVRVIVLLVCATMSTGAIINSGVDGTAWTIDTTSKAGRVSLYDTRGNFLGMKASYSAATTAKTATAAGTAPFFEFCGSGTKTVRVTRLSISGTVATAAVYGDIVIRKYSTQASGGTATDLTMVPHDANSAAATAARAKYYTALPTAGTQVGSLWAEQRFFPVTGTAALFNHDQPFFMRDQLETENWTLRATTQCIAAMFGTTTTNAPTLAVTIAWTEE